MAKDHTPPLFFISEEDKKEDHVFLKGAELRHALAQRLSPGEEFRAATGDLVIHARVEKVGKDMLVGSIVYQVQKEKIPISIHLAPCLLKGQKMELVVEKATELGATSIQPLISGRTVPKLDSGKALAKKMRWERVAKAAAQQCARAHLPEIKEIMPIKSFLAGSFGRGAMLFAYERRDKCISPEEALKGKDEVTLIVGPEGGFHPEEVSSMSEAGYLPVSFGPFIMRAETASIAATAILAEKPSSPFRI